MPDPLVPAVPKFLRRISILSVYTHTCTQKFTHSAQGYGGADLKVMGREVVTPSRGKLLCLARKPSHNHMLGCAPWCFYWVSLIFYPKTRRGNGKGPRESTGQERGVCRPLKSSATTLLWVAIQRPKIFFPKVVHKPHLTLVLGLNFELSWTLLPCSL